MSGSLLETLTEGERLANRSCAITALWVAAVLTAICLIGLTGAFGISRQWMCFYAGAIVLPILAASAYAKKRGFQGGEIKHVMIAVASLIPACFAVPTLFGFFLMPLPVVVAGRYFSRRLVWETYLMVLVLTFATTVPHAYFGVPSYPLCEESRSGLLLFLDGRFSPSRYWRYLVVYCYPSFALCLLFFSIAMSRLCESHLDALKLQARLNARLADVEKGLAIAATMAFVREQDSSLAGAAGDEPGDGNRGGFAPGARQPATGANQPKVDTWSQTQIIKCISRCKKRAAADPEFAALVERDPAAAVRDVQS